ncbi:hypothetical protein [Paenibacillus kobensis]|uniref:hypothetical protein n=1 Tax=Paenibacillus kobensis TaxID=59841 RepID=UPI000FDBC400|nr:hypothetical protein [Paenibacillus kobensis]
MNNKWTAGWKAAAVLLLGASLLAACGSKDSTNTANGAGGQENSQQNWGGPNGGNGGGYRQMASAPNQPERQADLFAKIVSINGNSIVVKQADMSSMPQGGFGGSRRGAGNGQSGAAGNDAGQLPAAGGGQLPADGGGQPPADGQGGGRQMPDLFTGEETTVNIPEGAAIYKLVRADDGSMNYEPVQPSDLAADDIINIWLKEGTTDAEYISLRGGFGGFGGGFGGGNGGGQAGGDAPADNGGVAQAG